MEWPPSHIVKVGDEFQLHPIEIIDGEEYESLMALARSIEQEIPSAWVEADPECLVCFDDGLVEVGHTVYRLGNRVCRNNEDMAPCPKCDRGKELEFPLERLGPWGSEGFWRGQSWKVVRSGVLEIETA